MTPERWQPLDELFQSRLEREPDKRALLETPLIARLRRRAFRIILSFGRDPFLNRIRQAPEFIQFMTAQRAQWEKYRAEFDN
jgi:hypothetical protein